MTHFIVLRIVAKLLIPLILLFALYVQFHGDFGPGGGFQGGVILGAAFILLALAFGIRELDYFLDRYVADGLWQVLIAVAGALVIAYAYRQRRRLQIALARLWPSPAMAMLFAGGVILFAFVRLVGHEPLWQAILGDELARIPFCQS